MSARAERSTDGTCLEQISSFLQAGMEAEMVANQHAAATVLYCSF